MTATTVSPAPTVRGRVRGLVRGRPADPRWVRPALLALLAGTAVLYLVGLGASGWANAFYSAAAQAGASNWEAFLYGSSDAANGITVDKTPAFLWLMDLSVRVFGLNPWSVLVPQALCGVASVGVLYAAVRRWYPPAAAPAAGAVLALTPVAVLMFRFNNPDALLTLLLTAASYATLRAVERAGWRWLALAGALLGLGFLAKMLQALLVVPALAAAYLVAAPTRPARRVGHVLMAGAGDGAVRRLVGGAGRTGAGLVAPVHRGQPARQRAGTGLRVQRVRPAGLGGTTGYAVATAATPHTGSIPSAGPYGELLGGAPGRMIRYPQGAQNAGRQGPGQQGAGRRGSGMPGGGRNGGMTGQPPAGAGSPGAVGGSRGGAGSTNHALVALLAKTDARWAAAVQGSQAAAPLELSSGAAVLAIGGWGGTDYPTLSQFRHSWRPARSATTSRPVAGPAVATAPPSRAGSRRTTGPRPSAAPPCTTCPSRRKVTGRPAATCVKRHAEPFGVSLHAWWMAGAAWWPGR